MKLSVIIPTLNEAQYLAAAVESLRKQATCGGPHEIVVSDCGSIDDTPTVALRLNTRLVQDGRLESRAAALNKGAEHASGDALMFLDMEQGVYRVLANDIWIWVRDLLGFPTESLGMAYQQDNHLRGVRQGSADPA